MTTNTGWERISAYFRTRLDESELQPTTFAKRWGTNEKTLAKILDGTPVRGDAQQRIIAARGWPADAFERIGRGEDPTGAVDLVADLARRVDAIERRLDMEPSGPEVLAAIEGDPAIGARQKRQLSAAYRAALSEGSS